MIKRILGYTIFALMLLGMVAITIVGEGWLNALMIWAAIVGFIGIVNLACWLIDS